MLGRRTVAVFATSIFVLAGIPGTASAETVTQKDRTGEAAAKFDIVRVTYTNNTRALKYRVKLRNIRPKDGVLVFPKLLSGPSWREFLQVNSGARRDGTRFHALHFNSPKGHVRVRCPGMTGSVNFATDVVTARVPQACMARVNFAHRRYLAVAYAATPGMMEAGDATRTRWVAYD